MIWLLRRWINHPREGVKILLLKESVNDCLGELSLAKRYRFFLVSKIKASPKNGKKKYENI